MRKYAELADSVIHLNHRIPERKCRHEPLVIVAAVALIHDAAVVRLDDAEVLEGRAARHNMRLKPLWQLHGNPAESAEIRPFSALHALPHAGQSSRISRQCSAVFRFYRSDI